MEYSTQEKTPLGVAAMTAGVSADYVTQLSDAFRIFNEGAERMKHMYAKLEKRVVYLTDELDKKNRELERAHRLAALGELAAGVAHEIRNPLCGIELSATLLQRDAAVAAERQELIGNIVEGVRRLDTIVGNLLSFTRDQKMQRRGCDIAQIIQETIQAVEFKRARHNVVIRTRMLCAQTELEADPDQLRQVLVNIALNAIEAMPHAGTVTFRVEQPAAAPAWLLITVRDTGCGIAPEHLERIFDPFFSTKDQGTGLGLSISHRIVEAHGGSIRVSSRAGKGTVFRISVPRQAATIAQPRDTGRRQL